MISFFHLTLQIPWSHAKKKMNNMASCANIFNMNVFKHNKKSIYCGPICKW